MEGKKPTKLACTVLPINHTNLCYKVCSVCGKGFDLMSDFRLKFAKGTQRLVVVDEFNNRDILIPAGPPFLLFLFVNVYYVMGFRPSYFTYIAHLYLYYTLLVPHTYASYIRH